MKLGRRMPFFNRRRTREFVANDSETLRLRSSSRKLSVLENWRICVVRAWVLPFSQLSRNQRPLPLRPRDIFEARRQDSKVASGSTFATSASPIGRRQSNILLVGKISSPRAILHSAHARAQSHPDNSPSVL